MVEVVALEETGVAAITWVAGLVADIVLRELTSKKSIITAGRKFTRSLYTASLYTANLLSLTAANVISSR